MSNLNSQTRQRIIDTCLKNGFAVQLKADGSDLYEKNLVVKSNRYPSRVFIHTETGISKVSGDFTFLKIAVHPDSFKEELVNPALGIESLLNKQTKHNLFSSSNYVEFPRFERNKEPCGKCYKLDGLIALKKLLIGLQGA